MAKRLCSSKAAAGFSQIRTLSLLDLKFCRRTACNSVMACLQTGENWYWKGSGNIRDKNLHPLDVNGVQDLRIENSAEECVKMTAQNRLEDATCTDNARKVCVMTYGGAGIGSSIGKKPNYKKYQCVKADGYQSSINHVVTFFTSPPRSLLLDKANVVK